MSSAAGDSTLALPRHLAARRRMVAGAFGLVAAGIASAFLPWQVTVLVGWSTAAAFFLMRVWLAVLPMDAASTARLATREDDSRVAADLTLLAASVASLVAVGLTLVKGAQEGRGTEAAYTAVAVLSVVLAWAVVHTVFALGYARLYYIEPPGGIDFHDDGDPTFRDFAYVAFTVGMTYQVSDSEITAQPIRAALLRHALLSFLFGSVIIAMTINVVAGLVR